MPEAPKPTTLPRERLSPRPGWLHEADVAGRPTVLAWTGVLVGDGPLRLGRPGDRAIALNEPFGSFGGQRLPRGLAISDDGRLFLADPGRGVVLTALAGEINGFVTDAEAFRALWPRRSDPTDPYRLVEPTDVAIGPRDTLLIADRGGDPPPPDTPAARQRKAEIGPGKVLVIDWPSGVIREVIALPGWRPSALAVDGRGRLHVADAAGSTVHRFDTHWQLDPDFPHRTTVLDRPTHLALAAPAEQRHCDCGGACAHSGRPRSDAPFLFVLGPTGVVALNERGRVVDAEVGPMLPPALRPVPGGLAYADAAQPRPRSLRIPLRRLTPDGRVEGLGLPFVAVPRRIRLPRSGTALFGRFDSDRRGFPWDRVALSISMPPQGSLVVEAVTSDRPISDDVIETSFDDLRPTAMAIGPGDLPEVLVQSPPGRYLWLRLTLLGDGSQSPEVHRIDVFGPRNSSINLLPAPYHQDPQSRDFLDRFLSYFDTIFAELRAANRETATLFDPEAVPEGDWLDWLGSWFDLEFLAEWSVETRREMVAAAVEHARSRGTRDGTARMLRWHLSLPPPWPMLIEHFRLGPESPPLAHEPLPRQPEPHRLTIVLPRAWVPPDAETRLQRMVDRWLPAHVGARIAFVEPGLVIGRQSLLGIDTVLSGSEPRPLGQGRLGLDLSTRPVAGGAVLRPSTFKGADHV
ncbi:MAG: phage tail protein [Acidimicrobiia bacterium]